MLPLDRGCVAALCASAFTTFAFLPPTCAAAPESDYALLERHPSIPAMTALGRALFFDPALSASGRQSCASCHSPQHAYGPPDGSDVQRGGRDGRLAGTRAVPSVRYVQNEPTFTEHFHEGE